MGKTLIIAEKPSVAADLARVLAQRPGMAKFRKESDWYENDTHIISSAVGHLLELALPGTADGKRLKWNFESLPILPEKFELQPVEKSADRLKTLKRLLKRSDVTDIINACDAGREGELIFRYILQASGVRKPVRRLWMQSMTPKAILEAFDNLREEEDMKSLADAAVCRSESDWLVGINSTRALTAYNSRNGGFLKTPVGRVQTPTLAILANRAREIASFVPRDYWEVYGTFEVPSGTYRGRWFDESFSRDPSNPHARAERIWDQEMADAIQARCDGRDGIIEETRKPARQIPPQLYDLTTLQREASNRFGFSARRTLQLAQALYESHKVLTYPRTDSRYLPNDYLGTVKDVMKTLAGAQSGAVMEDLPEHAARAVREGYVKPNGRVFDDSRVSDHFAIIPTGQIPRSLKPEEAKIFDMVARRFVAVFHPAAEFEVTTRITRIDSDAFRTEGRVIKVPGWLQVYGKQAAAEGEEVMVPAENGGTAHAAEVAVEAHTTKPPPHFTEATLLSMMESAGKLVEDDELREAMSERGLGTPATRAAIIEGLILDQYIVRNGRDLIATPKGIALIDQLTEIGADALTSPQMTGEWEFKLKQMEHGRLDRDAFMREIRRLTTEVVDLARTAAAEAKARTYPDLPARCPVCGTSPMKQTDSHYQCSAPDCGYRLFKNIAGRPLSEAEAKELLENRILGPLDGFRNRFGQEFSASLELDAAHKPAFIFQKREVLEAEAAAIEDPARALCPCPVCAAAGRESKIFETDDAWVCEAVVRGENPCKPKGRLAKVMCGFEIPREQARKFFTEGSTDFIDRFVSKKGRPFTARLTCSTEGRSILNWEFPPRESKSAAEGDAAAPRTARKAARKSPARRTAARKTPTRNS